MKFSVLSSPTLDVLCFFLKSTKKKKYSFTACVTTAAMNPQTLLVIPLLKKGQHF